MRCKLTTKPRQIESSIDLPHQMMIFGNDVAMTKLMEQLTLVTLQMAIVVSGISWAGTLLARR